MANIVAPVAVGDSPASVKTKLVSIVESWRGAGFASGGNVPATWGAMRTLLNGVAALVGLPTIASSDTGTVARAKINALNEDTAGGRFAGSSLDLQFAANKAYGAADPLAPLTISRSSVGMVEDASGVWTSVAANFARRSNKGVLVEEARMNGVPNNAMVGAIVGTPGTPPTGWNLAPTADGLNFSIAATGVENGVDYIDLRIAGTVVAGAVITAPSFVSGNVIAALPGQTWANSFFAKVVSGSIAGLNCQISTVTFQSNGSTTVDTRHVPITVTGSLQRFTDTITATGATAYVSSRIRFTTPAAGSVVDVTLRIGMPQLELGASVTSPIRTTGTAATRAPDNGISLTSPTAYANLTEGSFYVEWTESIGAGASGNRTALAVLVDPSNYIRAAITTGGNLSFATVTGSATSCNLNSPNAVAAGQTVKSAARWKANDFAMRNDPAAGSPANDNTGPVPAGTFAVNLGTFGGNNQHLNGYIRRIALFQTAQNDAALSAMVA